MEPSGASEASRATVRYCAVLAYDGTDYQGFQRLSEGEPSVQAEVEAALAKVSGQQVTIIGAGRTDSGVHATGQVIAFDLAWKHEDDDQRHAIAGLLHGGQRFPIPYGAVHRRDVGRRGHG